jgi:AcrR family transcriptional regulator
MAAKELPRTAPAHAPDRAAAPAAVATAGLGARRQSKGYQRILDAAAAVFYEKGYSAASTQDIAARAGILKGSLYHYIASKEDLLRDVMGDFHEAILESAEAIVATTDDPLTTLRRLVVNHVLFNCAHSVQAGVCYNEFRSLGPGNWERMLAVRDRYEAMVRDVITSGQKAKVIRTDVDAKVATFNILGALNTLHHWFRDGGPLSADDIARQYSDMFVAALGGPRRS